MLHVVFDRRAFLESVVSKLYGYYDWEEMRHTVYRSDVWLSELDSYRTRGSEVEIVARDVCE